jgi:hypothetical protein
MHGIAVSRSYDMNERCVAVLNATLWCLLFCSRPALLGCYLTVCLVPSFGLLNIWLVFGLSR